MISFSWTGSERTYIDQPTISICDRVIIGRYGGNSEAGANKNEDGLMVWLDPQGDWEFIVILDAHQTDQSAQLMIKALHRQAETILSFLDKPVDEAFKRIHAQLLHLFHSPGFKAACQQVDGETSCLICIRKDRFLWWLSIGDCMLYLFHPDLYRLGQIAVNQRHFFEWIGRKNTFDLTVPCFSSGVRELRPGRNHLLLTTDGLLEYGEGLFEKHPEYLYELFSPMQEDRRLEESIWIALNHIHQSKGKDSATLIHWSYKVLPFHK